MNICFIPVRKNSRRVFRKNFRIFSKISLLEIAVESALASDIFDRIVIGTDYEDLLLSKSNPLVEVYHRPEEKMDGERFLIDVVQEFIFANKFSNSDTLVVRLATNPFCNPSDIRKGIFSFQTNSQRGVASFSETKVRSHLLFSSNGEVLEPKHLTSYLKSTKSDAGTEEYFFNEGFVIDSVESWQNRKTLLPTPVFPIFLESSGFFIDTETDFLIAQKIYDRIHQGDPLE